MVAPHRTTNGSHRDPGLNPAERQPFDAVIRDLSLAREHFSNYLEAKKDAAAATVRSVVAKAVLGVALGFIGLAVLVTSAVLLLVGAAQGIGALLGDRVWAGYLIVGGALIGLAVGALFLIIGKWQKSSRQRTVEKYEHRHEQQRAAREREAARRREELAERAAQR